MAMFTTKLLYRVPLLESVVVFPLLSPSFLARLALDLGVVAVSSALIFYLLVTDM